MEYPLFPNEFQNDIDDTDIDRLADGFAKRIKQLAKHLGAAEDIAQLTALAAAEVCRATEQGHVFVALNTLLNMLTAPFQQTLTLSAVRKALLTSGVVGDAQKYEQKENIVQQPPLLPLVLDSENRLYLARCYFHQLSNLIR